MTNEDHLHQETNIVPVRRNVRLLCVQQQLSRYLAYHPSHSFIHRHPHPRQIKKTLHTRYNRYVTPYLNETENKTHVTPKEYKRILKDMHTLEVKDAIENYAPSKVLDTMSSKISEEEKSLPRGSRRQLAKLRSGFRCLLQSYNHRIKCQMPWLPEIRTHNKASVQLPEKKDPIDNRNALEEPSGSRQVSGPPDLRNPRRLRQTITATTSHDTKVGGNIRDPCIITFGRCFYFSRNTFNRDRNGICRNSGQNWTTTHCQVCLAMFKKSNHESLRNHYSKVCLKKTTQNITKIQKI